MHRPFSRRWMSSVVLASPTRCQYPHSTTRHTPVAIPTLHLPGRCLPHILTTHTILTIPHTRQLPAHPPSNPGSPHTYFRFRSLRRRMPLRANGRRLNGLHGHGTHVPGTVHPPAQTRQPACRAGRTAGREVRSGKVPLMFGEARSPRPRRPRERLIAGRGTRRPVRGARPPRNSV